MTVPGADRLVALEVTVQRRPRRDSAVLACPAAMPTRLEPAAFATVVEDGMAMVGGGGAEVLGDDEADVVGSTVALVAAALVAAWLVSGSTPARSSSTPTLPATTQNPLRRHSGFGFGGRAGGGGPHPAGWVGGWFGGGGSGCCPQPCGFTHRSGTAGPLPPVTHAHIVKGVRHARIVTPALGMLARGVREQRGAWGVVSCVWKGRANDDAGA